MPPSLQKIVDTYDHIQVTVENTATITKEMAVTLHQIQTLISRGSTISTKMLNTSFAGAGLYTGYKSSQRMFIATSREARVLYKLSFACSMSAIVSGASAAVNETCQFSHVAFTSELAGSIFLDLGNRAYVTALVREGRPVPPDLLRYAPSPKSLPFLREGYNRQYFGPNGEPLAFVMPGSYNDLHLSYFIEKIPFQTIGRLVGISITLYGYSKIVIIGYQYSQKLVQKYKLLRAKRRKKLFDRKCHTATLAPHSATLAVYRAIFSPCLISSSRLSYIRFLIVVLYYVEI